MQPAREKLVAFDEAHDRLLIQGELAQALRGCCDAVVHEPLPEAIERLLLRVASEERSRLASR